MLLMAVLLIASQDVGITAKQKTLSVEEVLGGKIKQTDVERDAAKELKRHHRAIEKELKRIRKGNGVFGFSSKPQKAKKTRSLPANSRSY